MRKFVLLFSVIAIAACNANQEAEVKSAKASDSTSTAAAVTYPYTASYSSNFQMGDPKNAQTVLNLFKAWDDNKLDDIMNNFADTVTWFFSNGMVFHGSRDSLLSVAKAHRATLGTVKTNVDAFISTKSVDKNEDWVSVWFVEHRTDASGKQDSTAMQETWRLNNQGKADLLLSYERMSPPPQKK